MSYCDSNQVDIIDLVLQSYQIAVTSYQLLVRLFVGDHIMCSEFIVVVRYLYQLLVVCGTIVLVAISPVF